MTAGRSSSGQTHEKENAMKVMMFAIASKATEAGKPPTKEAILAMHQFNEELEKAGVLLDLGGLKPTSQGARVKYSGNKATVEIRPLFDASDFDPGKGV